MLRQDDFLKGQIALEAWRQTLEYGGHLAAVMVMGCIMNRVRLGWGSHLDVLSGIPNSSARNVEPNRDRFPSIWEPNFVRLLHEIDSQFDGSGVDLSKGALYWADLRYVERDWFKDKILGRSDLHSRIADMNSLVFFK